MANGSPERHLDLPEDFSEEFFKIVVRSVDFRGFAPGDLALRTLVVRLTSRGRSPEAITLVRSTSGLGEKESEDLIERVENAADRVFYATGLRPSLREHDGKGIDSVG